MKEAKNKINNREENKIREDAIKQQESMHKK